MRFQDQDFEDGRSYGIWELSEKLKMYASETNNSRIIEIIYNALYHVEKNDRKILKDVKKESSY